MFALNTEELWNNHTSVKFANCSEINTDEDIFIVTNKNSFKDAFASFLWGEASSIIILAVQYS